MRVFIWFLCIVGVLIICQILIVIVKRYKRGEIISQKATIIKIEDSITGIYSPVRHRTGDYSMAKYKKMVTFQLSDESILTLELNAQQAKKLEVNMRGTLKISNTAFVAFGLDN